MRVIQKIVVISLAVFISAFFIPTVFNIICNGGNKGDTLRHYCKICGKKLIHHSKPCVKE